MEQGNVQSPIYPDVVTFGESMALLMPDSGKGIEYSPQLTASFGGAESNVAIGLARLGHRVGWFGRLGKDPFGRMVLKKYAAKAWTSPGPCYRPRRRRV